MVGPLREDSISREVIERSRSAVHCLVEALEFARKTESDPWQFGVEMSCLLDRGMSKTDLRWVVLNGLVHHGYEVTLPGANKRSFEPSTCLRFVENSCFMLTEAAEQLIARLGKTNVSARTTENLTPKWLSATRVLLFQDTVVKQFKAPAPNQVAILTAFEEEHWPRRIDDPLAPRVGQDSRRRLHDTINALNRNQRQNLIRFYGDGTGEGLCWEPR